MGCWDETCALTLLPIYVGQEAVMVVIGVQGTIAFKKYGSEFLFGRDKLPYWIEAVHQGKYNDYGWIEGVDNPPGKNEIDPKDTYSQRVLSLRRVTIFFHKEAWDYAVKEKLAEANGLRHFYEGYRSGSVYDPPLLTNEQIEFLAVVRYARGVRRDLGVCEAFHGSQSGDCDQYDRLHKLTEKLNNLNRKRLEE